LMDAKPTPAVYAAIAKVQGELARVGISKARKNAQQNFAFRGIDDVYAALSPLLADAGLCVFPRVLHRETVERTTKSGGALYFVTVHAEFDFVAVADGSQHTASTYGEASDSGDKATNKAMSAAYKYAAFMTFCIPTEGDNDADAHTPEPIVPRDWAAWAVDFMRQVTAAPDTRALAALRDDTAADRAALKAADPKISANVNAAYKTRAAELAAAQQKEI
jgi:hypothetical protein